MRVSMLEEYGVRCALQLARSHESGPMAASVIAKAEGISPEYVGKIMFLFRRSGIVKSERGNQGGFLLSESPGSVNLQRVFHALAGKKDASDDFCTHYAGQEQACVHHEECSVRPVWSLLNDCFEQVLSSLSLEDLLVQESEIRKRVGTIAQAKASEMVESVKAAGEK